MNKIVAIVGRPNVGKSTLFNRLIGERKSIVDDVSGVTRDRQYGISDWNGKDFTVIDTGGFVEHSEDVFEKAIREQVKIALEEAGLILFMVDVTCGITDLDQDIANILRKTNKPVITVVNKVDNASRELDATEFYSLGLGEMFTLSSISGSGTGELLDRVAELLPDAKAEEEEDIPKFTIVGRPNVGKSSFLNALLGQERNVVTDVAGTTRDSIHTRYDYFNKDFLLIDTAGIRKKAKVHENLEFYSVIRAVKAIDEADVCFLMIDATIGLESQDLNIFSLIRKRKKGVVILVNKWDLMKKETNTTKEYEKSIREKTAPFTDIPIIFISALTKQRIFKAIETAIDVYKNRSKKIPTSKLNNVMLEAIERYKPPVVKDKFVKIKYITQLKSPTPTFAFFCNLPQYIKESYKRYLENQLREHFNFTGVPVSLYFRKK